MTITPPTAWATANNVNPLISYSVNLEQPGTRRNYTYQNCDFRLEKRFGLGKFGELDAYVDVFNLLGQNYIDINQNPGGGLETHGQQCVDGDLHREWNL